jgi:hypothetical protein
VLRSAAPLVCVTSLPAVLRRPPSSVRWRRLASGRLGGCTPQACGAAAPPCASVGADALLRRSAAALLSPLPLRARLRACRARGVGDERVDCVMLSAHKEVWRWGVKRCGVRRAGGTVCSLCAPVRPRPLTNGPSAQSGSFRTSPSPRHPRCWAAGEASAAPHARCAAGLMRWCVLRRRGALRGLCGPAWRAACLRAAWLRSQLGSSLTPSSRARPPRPEGPPSLSCWLSAHRTGHPRAPRSVAAARAL